MGKIICPECGHSHTIENDGVDDIDHLYYCNYCHMWFIYIPLAWNLPLNPDTVRARKRMQELGIRKANEEESKDAIDE